MRNKLCKTLQQCESIAVFQVPRLKIFSFVFRSKKDFLEFYEIIVSFKSWRVTTVLLCEYRTLRDPHRFIFNGFQLVGNMAAPISLLLLLLLGGGRSCWLHC